MGKIERSRWRVKQKKKSFFHIGTVYYWCDPANRFTRSKIWPTEKRWPTIRNIVIIIFVVIGAGRPGFFDWIFHARDRYRYGLEDERNGHETKADLAPDTMTAGRYNTAIIRARPYTQSPFIRKRRANTNYNVYVYIYIYTINYITRVYIFICIQCLQTPWYRWETWMRWAENESHRSSNQRGKSRFIRKGQNQTRASL